jgi:parallel beta-helix repeat protein
MSCRRTAQLLLAILVIVPAAAAQDSHLWVGPNVNMVSGTTFPDGDPFLQRQNEPSIAVSTRDTMTLMGFANDYRAVDLPGLQLGKETGDAWLGVFKSFDGGQTWQSTLLPGYPQDDSQEGLDSPIGRSFGAYEAAADPVVRAGTHGLFYLSGIVFDRGDPARSALFVARYVDLNNLESGDTIEYIDTGIVKANAAVDAFIDKPWMAVDIPRSADPAVTMSVNQSEKVLSQSVECGNVYLAWAEVFGLAPNQRSNIMFTRSSDCGATWSDNPIILNSFDTMAQGVSIAVSPSNGDVWVTWRQFNTTPPCTADAGFWKNHPEEWAIRQMTLGKTKYSAAEILDILNTPTGGDATYILAHHLIAAKLNVASGISGDSLEDAIDAADDWLKDYPLGSNPPNPERQEGIDLKDVVIAHNQGLMEGCFGEGGSENAIMAVRSTDAALNLDSIIFSPPTEVSTLHPFEQGTTIYSFRTNAYPTITVDDSQPDNRAYIAYAARGFGIPRDDVDEGDARVVVSTSTDSVNWTIPTAVDQPEVPGHQFDPSITFAAGKVVLVYYDLRQDFSGIFDRFIADIPAITPIYRHTVDVRAAQADPDAVPEFTSYGIAPERPSSQASRYVFMADYPGEPGSPEYSETPEYLQLQFNPPNLPINVDGLKPFFGDYLDVGASPPFVPDGNGWRFNTTAEDGAATFHAVWTDNRDVEAPYDGDWSNYVVPGDEHESVYDPDQTVPACDQVQNSEGQTRIRNQNIYTARLSSGLSLGSAGASRPVDALQRAFVVNVRNDSEETRTFELSFAETTGVTASFEQFQPTETLLVRVAPFSSASRTVFVTAENGVAPEPVRVEVQEVGGGGLASSILLNPDPTNPPPPADSGLLTAEYYDPAMMNRTETTPAMMNLAMMNPAMMNLAMMNLAMMNPAMMNLAMMNPAMMNLAMMNLAMMNPAMMNLAMMNPAMMNPAMMNLAMMNPAMMNPAMMNLAMMNPAMMNLAMMNTPPDEITWEMTNEGNASAAYSFNLLGENAPPPCEPCNEGSCDPEPCFVFQLFIYREYTTPAADGCELIEATQQQMLVNVVDPDFILDPTDPEQLNEFFRDPWRITDEGLDNPTFTLEPGDTVYATLWIYDYDYDLQQAKNSGWRQSIKSSTFGPGNVWASIVAQPVNTDDVAEGKTEPSFDSDLLIITTTSLPVATVGVPYTQILTSTTGLGPQKIWSLVPDPGNPPGISVSIDGVLSGTVTLGGTYQVTIEVTDTFETDQTTLTLQVEEAIVAPPSAPDATPIGGLVESPITVLVEDGNGDPLEGYEVTLQLASHPSGGTAHDNVEWTAADGVASFDTVWFDQIGDGYELIAEVALTEGVIVVATAPSDPFDVIPLVVTTTADDGAGSLRRAIENAERNEGWKDTISFAISDGAGPHTIDLLSPLPSIWDSVIIDATTQPPGFVDAPLVHLDGAGAGGNARGITIRAADSEIRGLTIINFSSVGIYIENEADIWIDKNFVGTDGNADNGNAIGITANNCSGLILSNNVVSGNNGPGIRLGEAVTYSVISDNKIGTNADGDTAIANTSNGIWIIQSDSHHNTISNNVISGNLLAGIDLWNGPYENTIVGNLIGTDETGLLAVPNGTGISINDSNSNVVGGLNLAEKNLISGNTGYGILISGSSGNTIVGNTIGLKEGGASALPNILDGIFLRWSADNNTIGGSVAAARNVISGNHRSGVVSTGIESSGIVISSSNNNFVKGNFIGTDSSGTTGIGNEGRGIAISSSSQGNTIGGPAAGDKNVISGNGGAGIHLNSTQSNVIQGNFIGTDETGTADLGNAWIGITITNGATLNTVGGSDPGERNLISGNFGGLNISYGASNNVVEGNLIGTDINGNNPLGNDHHGIVVTITTDLNTLRGNLISGNLDYGINLNNAQSTLVVGNVIGINAAGTAKLPNAGGVTIGYGSQGNTIGGLTEVEANVISGNSAAGVLLFSEADSNIVEGNLIGTDASGTLEFGNSTSGVWLLSDDNTVQRNVISGNNYGISINSGSGNYIYGNFIGPDATGNNVIGPPPPNPTQYYGVHIQNISAQNNYIGGPVPGQGNVISGNREGIWMTGNCSNNFVQGNLIGVGADGTTALGNMNAGVVLSGGVSSNQIGGPGTNDGNVISAHGLGIMFDGSGANNEVEGNLIGTDTGDPLLGNWRGITIQNSADNLIRGNVITGNKGAGVAVGMDAADIDTTGFAIFSNSIYGNGGLGIDLASDDAVSAIDQLDADSGPNYLVNFPILNYARNGSTTTEVEGYLDIDPGETVLIDLYLNDPCDGSGFGEGEQHLTQFELVSHLDGLVFVAPDLDWGANLFYYVYRDENGHSRFGTMTPDGAITERFSLGSRVPDITFAAPDLGYGTNDFYYLRDDYAGGFTFMWLSTELMGEIANVGSGFDSLTFAAPDLGQGWGANLFYYLRRDGSGVSWFGTLTPAGIATDRIALGTGFDDITFVAPDVGYGLTNHFYYLRHDGSGFSTFGTLSPAGTVTDRFGVGFNSHAITYEAANLGFGGNLFYRLSRDQHGAGLSTLVTTDVFGSSTARFMVAPFTRYFPTGSDLDGKSISATATTGSGAYFETSEFSACVTVLP